MGVALGWMALALGAVSAAPEPGHGGVPIKYTVCFVEADGLGWRDAVFTRLTPVTRQGGATVWTAPADVAQRLIPHATKDPATHVLRAPAVTAWSGLPAHVTTRSNRQLVTQVAWNGDEHAVEARPETVRIGSATTISGRKLDQGVLVRIVLQDTQILAVHKVALGGLGGSTAAGTVKSVHWADPAGDDAGMPQTSTTSKTGLAKKSARDQDATSACCSAAATTACAACTKDADVRKVAVEVPEIGSQEIAGEWLIPKDGILLVSFGPHTVADNEGKAVIRERLAIVEAEEAMALPTPPNPRSGSWPTSSYSVPVLPSPSATSPAPASVAPALNLPLAPAEMPAAGMPPVPSRSIPQGYHSDGKAAELPQLPDDDADDADDASDSAEPRPSPQSKKSQQPGPATEAKPQPARPADAAMKKARYDVSSFPPLPTLFQPAPMVGLQFLLPIKPVSLKLPFNRRLEIEIYGRVVRQAQAAPSSEMVTKPCDGEKTTK